mgnify:CR=1 FL=1
MNRQRLQEFLNAVTAVRESVTDEVAAVIPAMYPEWSGDSVSYRTGDRILFNGILYKVLQNHTSQSTWTPEAALSLFSKILIPDSTKIPEWEQPNSTNPYKKGDRVTYDGKTWESQLITMCGRPGVYGWIEITN